jgi:uncharacterized protein (TIGR03083 family)
VNAASAYRLQAADTVETFLMGADAAVSALALPEVAAAWSRPSVLEDQSVGSLAGHLARGSVWVVADYLSAGEPEKPVSFESASAYYAELAGRATPEAHAAVRKRGADVAAAGPEAVLATARDRAAELRATLAGQPAERRVEVIGGAVMRLGDYLTTRVVEQVVHLDDLARSVDVDVRIPEPCVETALVVGVDIARLRHGSAAAVRALYRRGFGGILPVL